MNTTIQKATLSELDATWHIINECSKWLSSKGFDHWSHYYTKGIVEKELSSSLSQRKGREGLYLLFVDNKAIGTITISSQEPDYLAAEEIQKYWDDSKALYISMFGVLPEKQGKGYGDQLLRFVEGYAKNNNFRAIRFDARAEDLGLIKYYLRQGFHIVGYIEEDNENYYLFEKRLQSNIT